MNKESPSSKRASLSVPGTSGLVDDGTPTINQLLAGTRISQPIIVSTSYLTVNSNVTPGTHHQQHRGRS